MKRHLIIDGTAVYEIDEDCMLKKRVDKKEDKEISNRPQKNEAARSAKRHMPGL